MIIIGDEMIIYLFKNKKNGKKYVGQTVRDLDTRISEHLRKSNTYFEKALKKYGLRNFDYQVVDTADDIEELNSLERQWIKKEGTLFPNGYNLCTGGNVTTGYRHSAESRRRMSEHQGRRKAMSGENNPFFGRKHTDETRRKMREAWTTERKEALAERQKTIDMSSVYVRVRNANTGKVYESIASASEDTGVLSTHITRVCKGKRKTAGGIKWEYVDK